MQSKNRLEPGLVRYIVEGAAQESARSLELLRAIEVTVQVNELFTESFEHIAHRLSMAVESICGRPADNPAEPIDSDGTIRASLETTLEVLCLIAGRMDVVRKSAVNDRELREDDGVVESFNKAIAAVIEAHAIINELNWAIMEHDADRSPLSGKGPFRSAKELLAALCE